LPAVTSFVPARSSGGRRRRLPGCRLRHPAFRTTICPVSDAACPF